jgi:hypothetical protein
LHDFSKEQDTTSGVRKRDGTAMDSEGGKWHQVMHFQSKRIKIFILFFVLSCDELRATPPSLCPYLGNGLRHENAVLAVVFIWHVKNTN